MSRPAVRNAAGYFVALLIVVVTWAIGIPRFASPDEPAHVYKAYGTAHGQLLGKAAPGFPNNLREFDGPAVLGPPNLNCYNGLPDVPASCATEISPRLISSAARYPPWYYGLVGLPVAASGQADRVVPYRLVSAVLCAALVTLAMLLAKRSRRSEVVALQLAALTPMALFLMGSVNPNAIEIAGFVAIWAGLSRVMTDDEFPMRLLILASCLSAAVVLMRPIAIVWMAGLVAVAIIAANPRRRRELLFSKRSLAWAIGPTALALVGSWLWLLYARIELKDQRATNTLTLSSALRKSIDMWPTYLRQTIGVLGWLDTTLPFFVYVAWIVALVIVVFVVLRSAAPRGYWAIAALVVVWLALPLMINGFTNSRAGLTYQGRYSVPIFAGLVFLPMFNDGTKLWVPRISQRELIKVVLALVVIAEVGAFWQMLRRFSVGANGKIFLTGNISWKPPVAPMQLVAINALAMLALAWSAWSPWGQVEAATGEWHGEGAQHGSDRSE
jgi:hypothetical protein